MNRKSIVLLLAIVLFASLVSAGGVGLGAPRPDPTATESASPTASATPAPTSEDNPPDTFPPLSKDPSLKPSGGDGTVNISDAKMKAALLAATGVSAGTSLKRSDLAMLTGGLDLSGKGITKADALQYCENISDLNLTDNNLADLPSSFSKLTKLKNLILDSNKLAKIPDSVYSLTGLTNLSMRNNGGITKVGDKIGNLLQLQDLDLSNCGIDTVSLNISKLSMLQTLSLNGNKLRTISRDVFLLPNLETLDLSDNVLKALPNEAATTPRLVSLNVEKNILDTLPPNLGSAPSLIKVEASVNRLTTIEPSLLSGKISYLTLDVNRLTELPVGLTAKTFDTISIEWNFIDMAEGSDSRKIADSVTATTKAYLRQLKILPAPQAKSTPTTVFLQWQMMEDGLEGDSSWKVNKYQIYIDNNGTWGNPIAELDKLATQYVATGLKTDKAYKFQVGVEYSLTLNGNKVSHRYFTPVEIKTLAANATAEPTVEPTVEPQPTVTEDTSAATAGPEPTEPPKSASSGGGSSRTTLVIVIIVGAVAVLVIGGVLALSMSRRNGRQY